MMNKIRFLTLFAVWAVLVGGLRASETGDNFAKWLPNMAAEDVNARKDAQQNWQNLCRHGSNDKAILAEVNQLMVDQLAKETPVETAAWLLRQLGFTGDDSVVPTLTKYLKNENVQLRDEAARALALVPGKKAEAALKADKTQVGKDALNEKNLDRVIVQTVGNETVMPLAIPFAEKKAVDQWMKTYEKQSDFEKAQTLAGLTVRGDKKFLPLALVAMKSEDESLRTAGLRAMEVFGTEKNVDALLEQCFSGADQDLAKTVLSRMVGKKFDDALMAQLKSEKDAGRFEVIADVLSRRCNADAEPVILTRAAAADVSNRLALLRIAEPLSSKDGVAAYVAVWELITDRGQRDQAEQVIARLVDGDSAPVIALRNEKNYAMMFSLLGRIGDEKSLKEIRDRVFNRPLDAGMTASPEFSAAALRAMCNWPDGRVAEDLLAVAESKDFSDGDRIAALRAFARVASLPWDRIKIKIDDKGKVALLAKGMELATRVDEKRLIIQRVGQVRCVESLQFVLKYFDDAELQHQVCWSIIDLAHHNDLRRRDKTAFDAALDKVIETSKDQGQLDRAKRYREN